MGTAGQRKLRQAAQRLPSSQAEKRPLWISALTPTPAAFTHTCCTPTGEVVLVESGRAPKHARPTSALWSGPPLQVQSPGHTGVLPSGEGPEETCLLPASTSCLLEGHCKLLRSPIQPHYSSSSPRAVLTTSGLEERYKRAQGKRLNGPPLLATHWDQAGLL